MVESPTTEEDNRRPRALLGVSDGPTGDHDLAARQARSLRRRLLRR